MTVPIIPNIWSALGQAASGGLNTYQQEQERQRREQLQNIQQFIQLLPNLTPNAAGGYDIPQNVQGAFQKITGGVPDLTPTSQQQAAALEVKALPKDIAQRQTGKELSNTGAALGNTAAQQGIDLGDLKLSEAKQIHDILTTLTPEQLMVMHNIPNEVDLTTLNDKNLTEVAQRYVFGARGNAKAGMVTALGDPRIAPLVKSGKLTKAFFDQAASLYADEQRKLDIEAQRAANSGGRYRTPQEYKDDLIRGLNQTYDNLSAQIQKIDANIAGGIINPKLIQERAALKQQKDAVYNQLQVAQQTFGEQVIPGFNERTRNAPTPPSPSSRAPVPVEQQGVAPTPAPVGGNVDISSIVSDIRSGAAKISDAEALYKQNKLTAAQMAVIRLLLTGQGTANAAFNPSAAALEQAKKDTAARQKKSQNDTVRKRLFQNP